VSTRPAPVPAAPDDWRDTRGGYDPRRGGRFGGRL